MQLLSVSSVFHTIGTVLLAILILLAMITVHELGHYVAGKALKFKINEFAIGFGPKLYRRVSKKTGEAFSVRALPLGGFCAFEGEDGDGETQTSENAFTKKAPWKRIIVLVAGPLFNYLFALLLIMISMFAFGQLLIKVDTMEANEVAPAEYSLCEGDLIMEIDGTGIYLVSDFMTALNGKNAGDSVTAKIVRGGELIETEIMIRANCDFANSAEAGKIWDALGISTARTENFRIGFFTTVGHSFVYSFKIAGSIFKVLGELLTGRLSINAMGGPVTTISLTSKIAAQSLQSFFEIAAYIGVNLAVFNLLPIPALDGSKVIFCFIEWIFKKPVPRKVEAIIHAVGFILLLAFAVLVDVLQFVRC